jgi:hypothetical protein
VGWEQVATQGHRKETRIQTNRHLPGSSGPKAQQYDHCTDFIMSDKEGRLRQARTQEDDLGLMLKLWKLEESKCPEISHTSCFNLTICTQENKNTLPKM